MHDIVSIKPSASQSSVLIIDELLAERLGLSNRKRGFVSFGMQKHFVDIKVSGKLEENQLLISNNIIDYLHLPMFITTELNLKNNEIMLGPCIGILACHNKKDINKKRLGELSMNIIDYTTVHGAVIAFSLDMVDTKNMLISGFCYNHNTGTWDEGVFPYPSAVYNRTSLNEDWQNYFLTMIGDKVFNNYHFSKWEMFNWFTSEPDIINHLPYTCIYKTEDDIFRMLNKYKTVYVKPVWGMKGKGVFKVYSDGYAVVLKYRSDEKNNEIVCRSRDEAVNAFKTYFKPDFHIVQEGIQLISHNNGIVDFRCVMQKNQSSEWVCNDIVARIGASESIVSNISSGGMALPVIKLLRNGLKFSEFEAFAFKEKMAALCTKVSKAIDGYGVNFGTLGFDLGIDERKHIWIIEINNRCPHPAIALRVNDLQEYYQILCSPLYYAKSLAGFGE